MDLEFFSQLKNPAVTALPILSLQNKHEPFQLHLLSHAA